MTRRAKRGGCPICAEKAEAAFRPFCSARCKDEDLRRWLVGAYRIPAPLGVDPEDEDERQTSEEEEQ